MAIKTQDLNAKLFGKANKRKVTSQGEAQQAAQEKTPYIELSVAGEEVVNFELITIPADKIKEQTCVFAQNAREQAFLTQVALADILDTLQEKGQQFPAVGRLLEDGKIEVLDGSRRRMACLYAKKEFLVYVGKDIRTRHAKFLSDVANAHKPLSLFERGKEMQMLLESGKIVDQKELAKHFQCSEAIVSGALKAASLPLELLTAYPSVAELGRPTIVKLHRSYNQLSSEKQSELLTHLNKKEAPLWNEIEVQGISRMTSEVTKRIEALFSDLNPIRKKSSASVKTLLDGRISYSRKGRKVNLNLKDVDDEKLSQVLEYLQQLMN